MIAFGNIRAYDFYAALGRAFDHRAGRINSRRASRHHGRHNGRGHASNRGASFTWLEYIVRANGHTRGENRSWQRGSRLRRLGVTIAGSIGPLCEVFGCLTIEAVGNVRNRTGGRARRRARRRFFHRAPLFVTNLDRHGRRCGRRRSIHGW